MAVFCKHSSDRHIRYHRNLQFTGDELAQSRPVQAIDMAHALLGGG
jgi:hypothetical protein